jgi:hypothetical protein
VDGNEFTRVRGERIKRINRRMRCRSVPFERPNSNTARYRLYKRESRAVTTNVHRLCLQLFAVENVGHAPRIENMDGLAVVSSDWFTS